MTAEEAMNKIGQILKNGYISSKEEDGEYTDGKQLDDIYEVYEQYDKERQGCKE